VLQIGFNTIISKLTRSLEWACMYTSCWWLSGRSTFVHVRCDLVWQWPKLVYIFTFLKQFLGN